jgi:isoquinoline 1-oxidoreductase
MEPNITAQDSLTGEEIEVERYELREPPAYRFDANRREFVQVLGAGLVIAVAASTARGQRRGGSRGGPRSAKFSQRFHVGKDGVITVLTSKVECGQGSRTQLAMAAAEELHFPIEQIRLIMADTGQCPDDGGTAGSRTTPGNVPAIRAASAAAREVLVSLAAKRFKVEPATVRVEAGKFVAEARMETLTLADLVADESFAAAIDKQLPSGASVTPVDKWKVLGKPVAKLGGADVVTGRHQYPSDVVRPNMLYGKVLRAPSYGAKLRSIDVATAKAIDGVAVVHDGDFIGCAAASTFLAGKALDALADAAKWDSPENEPSSKTLYEDLKRTTGAGGGRGGFGRSRDNTWGNLEAALADSRRKIDAAYRIAYIQHAPMEPRAAVAEWNDGKLTVWTGTQQPSRVQGELASAFRLSGDKVRVIVPDTGGGFGGKHSGEAAVEAARLAKAAGRPVSLRWTREEEFTWAYFRPAGLIDVRAAVDDAGKLSAWDFTNYNSGGSAIDSPYKSASGRIRFVGSQAPLRQGSYRALASTANCFARESAIDELAKLAGADPLEFRLAHLPDGRLKDVLVAAAKKFEWSRRRNETDTPHGFGLACGTEKGSFVAACAEVEMSDGKPKVISVSQAFECGAIQNPANLRAQVVGCLVMGLGGALFEEIRYEKGRVTNASFSGYRVPRMKDVPQIDIVLVNRPDLPSVGAGETPIIAVAPAINNAIAHATGKHKRSLPLLGDA